MGKEKRVQMMPPPDLPMREGDVELAPERYLQLSFFARLKKKPSLERYPNTLRLRRFQKGDVICRQGEGGWTAFYALTATDILEGLRDELLKHVSPADRRAPEAELARLEAEQKLATEKGPHVATVHLALARPQPTQSKGLLGRLFGPAGSDAEAKRPKYIPIDAPRNVSYEARQAPLYAGDLFGEMSCLYGSPRSGTIVAERDWYMLEMLRHILSEVRRDDVYRAEVDRTYKERALGEQLRRLPIFSKLSDDGLKLIRDKAELLRCKLGDVICDEHERSDSMYIVRSGLVQAVKTAPYALALADVLDWPGLGARLQQGATEPTGPAGRLRQALLKAVPGPLGRLEGAGPATETDRVEVVFALNDFIREPPLPDAKAAKPVQEKSLPTGDALLAHFRGLDKDPKKWADQERRLFGRRYVEATCPNAFRPWKSREGMAYILNYQSQGDSIGELGLIAGQPRSATCLAYVHPEPDQGHSPAVSARWRDEEPIVELVRIPKEAFEELKGAAPEIARTVEEIARRHQERDARLLSAPGRDESSNVQMSDQFTELGLIQGQKLMLIDLNRCTRCDECVQACINTHADGRSRLFLDGPRFGNYLVPTTCRSCMDPVCLIGCPVGSIHRGDNREIIIEDWCIGCGLCGTNCPYGSIQMHDIGIVPQGTHGWRCALAATQSGLNWTLRGFSDRRWLPARTPILSDPDLRAGLGNPDKTVWAEGVCFRYELEMPAQVLRSAGEWTLEVFSPMAEADKLPLVWINGQEMKTEAKQRREGNREYTIPKEGGPLRAGRNVVAVKVLPTGKELERLLDLRLDEVRAPIVLPPSKTGDMVTGEIKVVPERAVVCDLCSGQWGQRPACVTACPHDAAMRVNARTDFPVG